MSTTLNAFLGLRKVNLIFKNVGIVRHYYIPPLSDKVLPKLSERVSGKTENKEDVWDDANSSRYTKVREIEGFWHFVERLKPKYQTLTEIEKLNPNKSTRTNNDLLEWRPAVQPPPNTPYYVGRTRNNVLPVYFVVEPRGPRQITKLKKIHGDIWALEKEIRAYLETKYQKEIETQVHEAVGFIKFKGSYLNDVQYWLYEKGF